MGPSEGEETSFHGRGERPDLPCAGQGESRRPTATHDALLDEVDVACFDLFDTLIRIDRERLPVVRRGGEEIRTTLPVVHERVFAERGVSLDRLMEAVRSMWSGVRRELNREEGERRRALRRDGRCGEIPAHAARDAQRGRARGGRGWRCRWRRRTTPPSCRRRFPWRARGRCSGECARAAAAPRSSRTGTTPARARPCWPRPVWPSCWTMW